MKTAAQQLAEIEEMKAKFFAEKENYQKELAQFQQDQSGHQQSVAEIQKMLEEVRKETEALKNLRKQAEISALKFDPNRVNHEESLKNMLEEKWNAHLKVQEERAKQRRVAEAQRVYAGQVRNALSKFDTRIGVIFDDAPSPVANVVDMAEKLFAKTGRKPAPEELAGFIADNTCKYLNKLGVDIKVELGDNEDRKDKPVETPTDLVVEAEQATDKPEAVKQKPEPKSYLELLRGGEQAPKWEYDEQALVDLVESSTTSDEQEQADSNAQQSGESEDLLTSLFDKAEGLGSDQGPESPPSATEGGQEKE